jgi:hypothetical protein
MNRLTSGLAALASLLLIAGCAGDPTESLRGPATELTALPSQLFIELGATKKVDVSAVDGQGNQLTENFVVTSVGSGITVVRDSSFRGVFQSDSVFAVPAEDLQFRFTVVGTAYGATSFTVSAGGVDKVIPVQVAPQNQIGTTFSTLTPALGDTVTITAPAGASFTQTAKLQLAAAADSTDPLIVERDPNGTFIRFIPPPNFNGPLVISEVTSTAAPGLVFSPATSELLTTPVIDSVDVTFSTATPTVGQTVTATIQNPLIKFRPDVASTGRVRFGMNFAGQLPGPLQGPDSLHVRIGSGPQAVVVAADSSSLTFQAPPNAAGAAQVVSFVFPGGMSLALPTRTGITSPNIGTTINATVSSATPAVLAPVTITAPAGLKFGPLAADTVIIGGQVAVNQSVAVDGSSITVIPIPGSSGTAVISGVQPTAAPQFTLTLPTVATITVAAIVPLTGTEDPGTAPSLTVPTAGNSFVLNDAGGFDGAGECCFDVGTRYYKLTIAAPTTLTFTLDWFQGQDLGVYITEADAVTVIDAGDGGGEGPTGHPETVTVPFTPGTYFVAIPNFSASNPSFFQLTLHNP